MLGSDYLRLRNLTVTTGSGGESAKIREDEHISPEQSQDSFGAALARQITQNQVDFSAHAIRRIESRNIDIENGKLERLNRGIEIAAQKGSNDALVLVDSTAFVVSVRNNRVITMMSNEDLRGTAVTNIDSTVII